MFAIYNNGSVGFRSSADNLYQIKNTDAPLSVALKPDDDTMFQELINSKEKNKENRSHTKEINTYKKMANIDIKEAVYHVQDIMTTNCTYLEVNATIIDVYNVLKDKNINQVPILSNEQKIMGLINKKIILNLLIDDIDNARSVLNKKIENLYLPELITTDPITDIRRVAKVMVDFKLDAIPVVNDDDILVGIVSKTDVIKAVSTIPKLQLWS
jgi:CBS domain-containing protein